MIFKNMKSIRTATKKIIVCEQNETCILFFYEIFHDYKCFNYQVRNKHVFCLCIYNRSIVATDTCSLHVPIMSACWASAMENCREPCNCNILERI